MICYIFDDNFVDIMLYSMFCFLCLLVKIIRICFGACWWTFVEIHIFSIFYSFFCLSCLFIYLRWLQIIYSFILYSISFCILFSISRTIIASHYSLLLSILISSIVPQFLVNSIRSAFHALSFFFFFIYSFLSSLLQPNHIFTIISPLQHLLLFSHFLTHFMTSFHSFFQNLIKF